MSARIDTEIGHTIGRKGRKLTTVGFKTLERLELVKTSRTETLLPSSADTRIRSTIGLSLTRPSISKTRT